MAQVHKTVRVLVFMFWAGFGGFGSLFWVSGSTPCFTLLSGMNHQVALSGLQCVWMLFSDLDKCIAIIDIYHNADKTHCVSTQRCVPVSLGECLMPCVRQKREIISMDHFHSQISPIVSSQKGTSGNFSQFCYWKFAHRNSSFTQMRTIWYIFTYMYPKKITRCHVGK